MVVAGGGDGSEGVGDRAVAEAVAAQFGDERAAASVGAARRLGHQRLMAIATQSYLTFANPGGRVHASPPA
jgi:hypothetical protein